MRTRLSIIKFFWGSLCVPATGHAVEFLFDLRHSIGLRLASARNEKGDPLKIRPNSLASNFNWKDISSNPIKFITTRL